MIIETQDDTSGDRAMIGRLVSQAIQQRRRARRRGLLVLTRLGLFILGAFSGVICFLLLSYAAGS